MAIGVIPWVAIGFGTGGTLISMHCLAILVVKGRQVAGWTDVAGHLDDLDVSENLSNPSRILATTATRIRARYSYQLGAAKFNGTNVSIMDLCPTVGVADSSELASMLKRSYNGDRSVRVFVNPLDPTEAVLTRQAYGNPVGAYFLTFALSIGILIAELFTSKPELFWGNASTVDWVVGVVLGLGLYLLARWR